MATVLITGANRGLGLEFCRQYAAEGWQVLACCRNPDTACQLTGMSQARVFPLDVTNFEQIDQLAAELHDTAIDVLINNAGVYGGPHNGFGQLDYAAWTQTLTVNCQAPVKMAEAFLPHLKRGDKKLLVSISSQMGSIVDNDSGKRRSPAGRLHPPGQPAAPRPGRRRGRPPPQPTSRPRQSAASSCARAPLLRSPRSSGRHGRRRVGQKARPAANMPTLTSGVRSLRRPANSQPWYRRCSQAHRRRPPLVARRTRRLCGAHPGVARVRRCGAP